MTIQCEYDAIVSPSFMRDLSREVELEANLKLTEDFPQMNQIKGGYFRVNSPQITVEQDRLSVTGTIFPYLLYVADAGHYPAEAADIRAEGSDEDFTGIETNYVAPLEYGFSWDDSQGVYFEEEIEIPGIHPDAYVEVDLKPLTAKFEREGPREVIFHGEIELLIHSATSQSVGIVKELQPLGRVAVQKEQILIGEMLERKHNTLTVHPSLLLPNLKPGISRILDYQVKPVELDLQTAGDKTHLKGYVEVTLVYIGSDDEGRPAEIFVNEWNREFGNAIPFDLSLDGPDMERKIFMPKVTVENSRVEIKSPREIQCHLELLGEAKIIRVVPKDIVIDVAAEAGEVLDSEKYLLNVEEYSGEVSGEIEIDQEVFLPSGFPDIERILSYRADLGKVSMEAGEEKVLVEGDLHLWVEYMADNDQTDRLAIASWEKSNGAALPIAGILNFAGLPTGSLLWSQLNLDFVKLEIAGDHSLHLTGSIKAQVIAKNPRTIMVVQNCALVPPIDPGTRPSMLFYVVQPGDTMWKIARRYQTTVDALAKVNQIANTARIDAGQKLIIPKKNKC